MRVLARTTSFRMTAVRATFGFLPAARRRSLVDGRPADQFTGKSKSPGVRVAGTIPGAVNIEHTDLYSAEYALFARPETIEALAMGVGLGADEDNITFCNTGHWASIAWFGLSEVLGNKNTRMYDGSMAEWTADPSLPVE